MRPIFAVLISLPLPLFGFAPSPPVTQSLAPKPNFPAAMVAGIDEMALRLIG